MQKAINKLLKEISEEKLKNNHKRCIELYNCVGGSYSEIGEYDAAIEYHEKALETAKTIGDRLDTAIAWRYIGEARAALGNFYQAIDDIKRYLKLAQTINDTVEIQRAWTTLGRVYLMQAQDMKDSSIVISESTKEVALKAEKHFQTALNLTGSVRDQVDEKEFAQMRSGLLVNIGLVKDICGEHKETVSRFVKAIEICKASKIKEDLFRCQIVLASIFRQKNNVQLAAKTSEEALNTAKSIGQKLLICDAYIERGLVKLWLRDFKDAKRNFVQAYFEKSPNEEDHYKAIRLAKLAHLICMKYQQLSQDSVPSEVRMKLCDKLGDLFVAVNCYKLAIEFYRRAHTDAKICSKPRSELARIIYSIAETYADDGQFAHAKACYEQEIKYRKGNDEEQCQSYIKIAHMDEYLNLEPEQTCKSYENALEKAGRNDKLVYNVLKDYVPYLERKFYNQSRKDVLKRRLLQIEESCPEVVAELETEGDEAEAQDIEDEAGNIDDIISDDEDNEELIVIGRRKTKASKFKRNEVGDTPLHKACIEGQLERVKSLISQGHEVNPRDNAGWIPLHEACNIGHYGIVEYLIEHGGDVNNRGLGGMSPLHDAAINGHYEVMRLLIKHGANVIALTDQGETVLNCLRDFKKRQCQLSQMRDSELTEYKQMEAELLNIMDRRGYNLMEQNMKQQQNGPSSSSIASKRRNVLTQEPTLSNPVKEYKNLIGSLKRKRVDRDEPTSKKPQPTTYAASSNPSAPTKEWLIDDVSREKQILNRRSNQRNLIDWDDEDEEEEEKREEVITLNDDVADSPVPPSLPTDDPSSSPPFAAPSPSTSFAVKSPSPFAVPNGEPAISHNHDSSSSWGRVSIPTSNKINVFVEGKKLAFTCKSLDDLKQSLIARHELFSSAKPKAIEFAPASDPNCILADLCQEDLVARITSWDLETPENTYLKACFEPLNFIKGELRQIEQKGRTLDLSFTRFPKAHVKPILSALAYRDFAFVDLTGATCFFETHGFEVTDTIATWRNLTHITLKCVGLRTVHFQTICSKMRFAELRTLDMSFNTIVYKSKPEFLAQIESLRASCPKLKKLDMSVNSLQFSETAHVEGLELLLTDQKSYRVTVL